MDLREELAIGTTESLREAFAGLAGDPEVRNVLGPRGLETLLSMSRTVEVTAEGSLEFASDEHRTKWKEWQFGSSRAAVVPISRMAERSIMGPIEELIKENF